MTTRYNISLEKLRAVVDQCGFNILEEKLSDGYIQIQMRYATFTGEFKRNIRIDSAAMAAMGGDTEHWDLHIHYPDIYDEGPDRDLRRALNDYALIKIGAPGIPMPKRKSIHELMGLASPGKDETTHLPKPKPAKEIYDELAEAAKAIGLPSKKSEIRGMKGISMIFDEFGEIEEGSIEAVKKAAYEKDLRKKIEVEELKARLDQMERNPEMVKRFSERYGFAKPAEPARPTNPLEGQW
ncbi:hypothetical protein [Dyella telluris]|uniref:Uncharacterized protein n=1 Tax=Dyella telluris TaxID=2763498 RepID=A0A7G8Q4K3_9GAMM|nr:hypothetical protein [Dyella telluris]QNK01711.1 hypothetical protein H8F01_00580 [Dyella telluris]